MGERRDEKLANILTRAAQLQEAEESDEVSLVQLEEAAQEVGIPRALVRRAAWEQAAEVVEPRRSQGIPVQVVRRRWIDADLTDPSVRGRLLARLDAFFGAQGERMEHDGGATWSARHVHVSFEEHEGGALVQISERFVNTLSQFTGLGLTVGMIAGAFLALMVLAGLGKGMLSGTLATLIVIVSTFVGAWWGRRQVHGRTEIAARSFEDALLSLERTAARPALGAARDEDERPKLSAGESPRE